MCLGKIAYQVLVVLALAGDVDVLAQQSSMALFESKSELVVVPAVISKDGKPIAGLSSHDFKVLHEGKPVELAFVEEIESEPAKLELRPKLSQTSATNHLLQNNPRQDTVVILLDFLNTTPVTSPKLRKRLPEIAKILSESGNPFTVLILSYKGLVVAQPVSSNPEDFVTAVRQWNERKPERNINDSLLSFAGVGQASSLVLQQFAVDPAGAPKDQGYVEPLNLAKGLMTLRAVEQISEAYRGVAGRKKLIWIGSKLPDFLSQDIDARTSKFVGDSYLRAWKDLSNANVALYPVIVNQLSMVGGYDTCGNPISPTFELAFKKGRNTCDDSPDDCVRKALADAPHYYVLGFYLKGRNKPGWHDLKIKVNRPNVEIKSRAGFFVDGEQEIDPWNISNRFVNAALGSPLDYTSIKLDLHWSLKNDEQAGQNLELTIAAPAREIAVVAGSVNLDVLVYANNRRGTGQKVIPISINREMSDAELLRLNSVGFQIVQNLDLPSGNHQIRALLRDNYSGKIGSVSAVVKVTE